MENINIKYQDIASRNGSESIFKWHNGHGVTQWEEKEGVLLSWSIASAYDTDQKNWIIPIGLVQEKISKKVILVPAKRITIKQ